MLCRETRGRNSCHSGRTRELWRLVRRVDLLRGAGVKTVAAAPVVWSRRRYALPSCGPTREYIAHPKNISQALLYYFTRARGDGSPRAGYVAPRARTRQDSSRFSSVQSRAEQDTDGNGRMARLPLLGGAPPVDLLRLDARRNCRRKHPDALTDQTRAVARRDVRLFVAAEARAGGRDAARRVLSLAGMHAPAPLRSLAGRRSLVVQVEQFDIYHDSHSREGRFLKRTD